MAQAVTQTARHRKGSNLQDKVVIVTGGNTGIGASIVLCLAEWGASIVIDYLFNPEATDALEREVAALGDQVIGVKADVSKVGDVKRLFDACFEKLKRLDILVNNAGVMFTKPVVEVGEEEFDRLFAVNVKGAFFCCQEAAKRMAQGGRIINLSSSTTALSRPCRWLSRRPRVPGRCWSTRCARQRRRPPRSRPLRAVCRVAMPPCRTRPPVPSQRRPGPGALPRPPRASV